MEENTIQYSKSFGKGGKASPANYFTLGGVNWCASFSESTSFDGTSSLDLNLEVVDFGEVGPFYFTLCTCFGHKHFKHSGFLYPNHSCIKYRDIERYLLIVDSYRVYFNFRIIVPLKTIPKGPHRMELFNSTFNTTINVTRNKKFPVGFNLEWFEKLNSNIRELIKVYDTTDFEKMTELEEVLEYVYHDYGKLSCINAEILRIEHLVKKYGFPLSSGFSNVIERLGTLTSPLIVEKHENFKCQEEDNWKIKISEKIEIEDSVYWNQMIVHEDNRMVTMQLVLYSTMFNNQKYLALGACLTASESSVFSRKAFECSISISSDRLEISGEGTRCFYSTQNSIVIPTLRKYSEEFRGPVNFEILVELREVNSISFPTVNNCFAMPGSNGITLKFPDGKSIEVNEDVLMDKVEYFNRYLTNEYFDGHGKSEVELKTFDYEGVYHMLDSLYHQTKFFSIDDFNKCSTTSDILACESVVELCRRAEYK